MQVRLTVRECNTVVNKAIPGQRASLGGSGCVQRILRLARVRLLPSQFCLAPSYRRSWLECGTLGVDSRDRDEGPAYQLRPASHVSRQARRQTTCLCPRYRIASSQAARGSSRGLSVGCVVDGASLRRRLLHNNPDRHDPTPHAAMRVNMRRMTPGAVFNSFLGILDLKLGKLKHHLP